MAGYEGYTEEQLKAAARRAVADGNTDSANRLIAAARAAASAPQGTSNLEQGMSGVNEGLANTLGFPVDVISGAINQGKRGINAVAGTDFQPSADPFLGSQSIQGMMGGAISDDDPQNLTQRFARRIGQEAGATAVPFGVMARGATNVARLGGLEAASALGAGVGGQTAREIAPDSVGADLFGSLLGGLSPIAASRSLRQGPTAPTYEEVAAGRDAAYQTVDDLGTTVNQQSRDGLLGRMDDMVLREGVDPELHRRAMVRIRNMNNMPSNPTISQVETQRQLVGRDVAGSAEAGESRIGVIMKNEIDEYLSTLTPADTAGVGAEESIAALTTARELAQRAFRINELTGNTGAITKAMRRAASTGTGGNEVNTVRQNMRAILDSDTRRRGFSAEELAAMDEIVEGTFMGNRLRQLSRLAPSSGGLSAMAGIGAGAAAAGTANPLYIIPSLLGEVGQFASERMSRRQVGLLDELVRNGAPLTPKTMLDYERQAVGGLLSARAANQE
ncbi:hypothetical protein DB2_20 [Octadecabacter Antarctic DB virus 2]|nr:hypothetical protein DB2_20 [Octadecabacter Antarctic DB virus 2]